MLNFVKDGFLRLLVGGLWIYQKMVSPWIAPRCRYAPTCSAYMTEALQTHGISKGLGLGFKRLSRCHPWGRSGFDPVPPPTPKRKV